MPKKKVEKHQCERCKQSVTYPVWLEMRWDDPEYYRLPGTIDKDHTQGCFPFHTACADEELRKHYAREFEPLKRKARAYDRIKKALEKIK